LSDLLQAHGHTVLEAASGIDALALLGPASVDRVVTKSARRA
jgi:hypothetical protein